MKSLLVQLRELELNFNQFDVINFSKDKDRYYHHRHLIQRYKLLIIESKMAHPCIRNEILSSFSRVNNNPEQGGSWEDIAEYLFYNYYINESEYDSL